jgi:hypothetical protein
MVPLFLLVRRCATLGCGFGIYCLCITVGLLGINRFTEPSTTPRPLKICQILDGLGKPSILYVFNVSVFIIFFYHIFSHNSRMTYLSQQVVIFLM